jgi:hypothetical protein
MKNTWSILLAGIFALFYTCGTAQTDSCIISLNAKLGLGGINWRFGDVLPYYGFGVEMGKRYKKSKVQLELSVTSSVLLNNKSDSTLVYELLSFNHRNYKLKQTSGAITAIYSHEILKRGAVGYGLFFSLSPSLVLFGKYSYNEFKIDNTTNDTVTTEVVEKYRLTSNPKEPFLPVLNIATSAGIEFDLTENLPLLLRVGVSYYQNGGIGTNKLRAFHYQNIWLSINYLINRK